RKTVPDRPRRHAHHRYRRGGPPTGEEGQAFVIAVGWGAFLDGGGFSCRDLQGPTFSLLRVGRGRGGPGRHQPPASSGDLRRVAEIVPAHCDHPPKTHDGGGRRLVRRHHAGGRHFPGDQSKARTSRLRAVGFLVGEPANVRLGGRIRPRTIALSSVVSRKGDPFVCSPCHVTVLLIGGCV